jgi:hypothetical protein
MAGWAESGPRSLTSHKTASRNTVRRVLATDLFMHTICDILLQEWVLSKYALYQFYLLAKNQIIFCQDQLIFLFEVKNNMVHVSTGMSDAEQNYFIADIFCNTASKIARSTLILAGPNRVNVVYKGIICKCWCMSQKVGSYPHCPKDCRNRKAIKKSLRNYYNTFPCCVRINVCSNSLENISLLFATISEGQWN